MDLDATSSRDPHAPVHAILAAVGSRPALSLTLQYAPHDDEPRIAYALTRMDPDGRTSESERTAVGQALLADLGPVPGLPEHAAADGSAAVAAGARVEGAVAFVRGSETTIAEGRWRDGASYERARDSALTATHWSTSTCIDPRRSLAQSMRGVTA